MAYKTSIKHVNGKKGKDIFIFALSTCGWCAKTKALLKKEGCEYSYVDVDLLDEAGQDEVRKDLEKLEADFSFPTIIINGMVISGFDEQEIMQALK